MARPDVTTLSRRGQMTRRRMLAGSLVVAVGALTGRARAALRGELVSSLEVDNGGAPFAGDRALFATLSPGGPRAEARDRPVQLAPAGARRATRALAQCAAREVPSSEGSSASTRTEQLSAAVEAAARRPARADLGAACEPRSGDVHAAAARDRAERQAHRVRHGDAGAPASVPGSDRAAARARCRVPAVELRARRRDDDVRRRGRARADGAALPVRPRDRPDVREQPAERRAGRRPACRSTGIRTSMGRRRST